ncbi:MAG: class I SAM-dependent methyltransferase [Anaerolineaceae bacterium]|nr:class I SAM-dependent methyltransferase [Anaerolineaceae bacterium]
MQAYNPAFAKVYNLRWGGFAAEVAPHLRDFYVATSLGQSGCREVLDLCCGAGAGALPFLEHGYHVTGLDLSPAMLEYARRNAAGYVELGAARFVQGDAADYTLDQPVGLAFSLYDALNHLPDRDALRRCFECTYRAVLPGGYFIFDLNTRRGLRRWAGVQTQEDDELFLLTRGVYSEEDRRAYTQITGFLRRDDGAYERFEQNAYNLILDMDWVRDALLESGWNTVHCAVMPKLDVPLEDPEKVNRVYFVAQRE